MSGRGQGSGEGEEEGEDGGSRGRETIQGKRPTKRCREQGEAMAGELSSAQPSKEEGSVPSFFSHS